MNFKLNIYLFLLLAVILSACDNTRIIDKNEQEWLKQHPNLTVGISPNAPPYQFVNEKGEISGIFIDFLTIIESRLNYSFKKVYQSDFAKLLADTKTGTIDILLEVQKTDERANYLAFTPPLLSHSHVFVVRSSQPNISTINNLKDRKISVVNLYAIHEYLGKNYPTIHLVPQFDDVSCLRSVSTGQSDAFVCQQAVATYFIEKEGISNLKISGELNYQNELAIASRKTIDTLNTILSKAVNSISNREKLNIYNTWLSYTVKPFYLEVKFWIIIFTLFLFGLFFTILFSLTLQQRVRQKTSELVLAKEETEESELRLKIAQAASKAGTWDWNIENNKYYWSDEFLSIFGMPTNTIAGSEAWRKVLYPDDVEKASQKIEDSIHSKTELINEYRIILPNREIHWVRSTGITLFENDKPIRMIGLCIDITAQKVLEQELYTAKEKAEESDRLKTAFLHNMSHEVRTPLNAITGFSQLMLKPNLPPDKLKKYSEIISNSSERLIGIITDVIEISQIHAKQITVELAQFDIISLINAINGTYSPKAKDKNIEFIVNINIPHQSFLVVSDREKLDRILTHLIDNAIKFTLKGEVVLSCKIEQESILLSVADTGIGICEEMQKVIFQPFRQVETDLTLNFGGNGLGLPIVNAYIELLHGTISLASEPNRGTTFNISIPAFVAPNQPTPKVEPERSCSLRTILIAEDEYSNYQYLLDLLEELNLTMLYAENGLQALEICQTDTEIDLVLMDIKMPIMDGHQAAILIKQLRPELPIIAQTAFALEKEKEVFISDFDDYISKPINGDELINMLMRYIDKSKIG